MDRAGGGTDADRAFAAALVDAVRRTVVDAAPDAADPAAAGADVPSIDLAVVDFAGARRANVLFSREHPRGIVATVAPGGGAVVDVRFDADLQDARGDSPAWAPGADWSALRFAPMTAPAAATARFVAPYPASLLKLMIAVGLGLAIDRGRLHDWPAAALPMIADSDNDATDDCVAQLHRAGVLATAPDHPLNAAFAGWGLPTLRVDGTTPAGGWRNADGAGVGRIRMTAWDTARLLWLVDPAAPPPPWRPRGAPPPLSAAVRRHLVALLARQRHDTVLSSGSLHDVPGRVAGFPDAPRFAHKTGTTDSYASDAGILVDGPRHAIVAAITSLGRRHAPHPRCATTWRLPALGAAIDALLGGAVGAPLPGGAGLHNRAWPNPDPNP